MRNNYEKLILDFVRLNIQFGEGFNEFVYRFGGLDTIVRILFHLKLPSKTNYFKKNVTSPCGVIKVN